MKKTVLYLLTVILLCVSAINAQSITVTSPNGGEILKKGASVQIQWNATGTANGFKITLWRCSSGPEEEAVADAGDMEPCNLVQVGTIDSNIPAGNGARSFSWVVGNYQGGIAPSGKYRIKIKEKGTAVNDMSNGNFRIQVPALYMVIPNGGELVIGKSYTIKFKSVLTTNPFKMTLWQNGSQIGVIQDNIPAGNGNHSVSWTVGQYNGGKASPGNGYKIKVKEKGTGVMDMSNQGILLKAMSTIPPYKFNVYKPLYASYHCAGDHLDIRWRNLLTKRDIYPYTLKPKFQKAGHQLSLKKYVKIEIKSANCPPRQPSKLREIYQEKKLPEVEIAKIAKLPFTFVKTKWETIVAKTADDGKYLWKIPQEYKKGCYKIRVTKLPDLQYSETVRSLYSAISKVFHIIPHVTIERVLEER